MHALHLSHIATAGPKRLDQPKRKTAMKEKLRDGMQSTCKCCGQDIEFHGKRIGWIDRWADRFCQLVPDNIAGWVKPRRKTLHRPA